MTYQSDTGPYQESTGEDPGSGVDTTVSRQGGSLPYTMANVLYGKGRVGLPTKADDIILELPMLKTLIVTILTAFTCGLLAETAVVLVQGVQGILPDIHTSIELGVCWFVVVATFFISVLKAVNNRWW